MSTPCAKIGLNTGIASRGGGMGVGYPHAAATGFGYGRLAGLRGVEDDG
jgi:hypothetical protein